MPRGNDKSPSPHRKPNVGRLSTLTSVRQEMARVYREARRREIPEQFAGRLVYMLSLIGKIIEGSDLEQRVSKLERKVGERNGGAYQP
ncbi:MAG: hypothetical protein QOH06_3758 [Acidobacteriota bacterium]|jgi:hypothetical protein|nr:hypothetical protein [Acidobacteriota bacterium]